MVSASRYFSAEIFGPQASGFLTVGRTTVRAWHSGYAPYSELAFRERARSEEVCSLIPHDRNDQGAIQLLCAANRVLCNHLAPRLSLFRCIARSESRLRTFPKHQSLTYLTPWSPYLRSETLNAACELLKSKRL